MKTYTRHKNICNTIICATLMGIMILAMHVIVYAASANVSISSSNVTQGEEFEVIVTIKADANIGAYNFYIDYDENVIEAVSGFNGGGNGRIQLMYYVPNTDVTKVLTAKIKFKAKNPGTTAIKYVSISDDNGVIDFDTTDNMSVTATEGSVTVKAPYVASTNNYLSNLKVEAVKSDGSTYSLSLSPAFSKDVKKYSAEAVEGVTKLVITADKEDSKANVKISGTSMDPGDNTTTITVTAEDGSTRKYVIYTTVAKPPETTTPPPQPIIVQIDGTDNYIEDINDAVVLPEGFETFEYQYKDKTVVAAKGLVKNLIVMYVTKGDGSSGQLYIYEADKDLFYPMANVQMAQKLYTIVKAPENLIIPEGFVETTVTVDGQSFTGWVNSEVENMYLIYAMNWKGESGLYYYDTVEGQVIRYFDVAVQAGVAVDDYNSLLSENEKLKDEINKLKADNNSKEETGNITLYKYLALISCIMAVVYLGIIIYLVVGKKSDNDEAEEDGSNTNNDANKDEIKDEDKDENIEENTEENTENNAEVSSDDSESDDKSLEETTEEMSEESSEEIINEQDVDAENEVVVEDIQAICDVMEEEAVLKQNESEDVTLETNESAETHIEEVITAEELITDIAVDGTTNEAVENDYAPLESYKGIDDEQDEIDDMLMDFDDINVEFAQEIVPEAAQLETVENNVEAESVEKSENIEETESVEVIENTEEEETIESIESIEDSEDIEEMMEAIESVEVEEIAESTENVEVEEIAESTENVEVEEIAEATENIEEEETVESTESIEEEEIIESTESIEEKEIAESTETTITEELSSDDKKKKVEKIMEDGESSISADDLDMVIDELFDDLFG